jgi:hypothetical protein
MTNSMFSLEKRKRVGERVFRTWFLFTAKYDAFVLVALIFFYENPLYMRITLHPL